MDDNLEDEMNWKDPFEDPCVAMGFSMQKSPPNSQDQEEWEECFQRNQADVAKKERNKSKSKRRGDKQKSNEKVAIKNVKKLILYVNNY